MTATLKTQSGLILYDDTVINHPGAPLFASDYWRKQDALQPTTGGRGASWIISRDAGDWVLRHYRRGGAVRFLDDRYFWPASIQRTRPWREWHYLAAMRARDLPVPRPVAARVKRSGLIWRGDLITERIQPARPLSAWLRAGDLDAVPWREIGATIARFHAAGAAHPDLNAHNILIQPDESVYLIDFDRGGWRRPGGPRIRKNLSRLKRSLLKVAIAADAESVEKEWWPALMEGYAKNPPPAPPSGLRPQRGE